MLQNVKMICLRRMYVNGGWAMYGCRAKRGKRGLQSWCDELSAWLTGFVGVVCPGVCVLSLSCPVPVPGREQEQPEETCRDTAWTIAWWKWWARERGRCDRVCLAHNTLLSP